MENSCFVILFIYLFIFKSKIKSIVEISYFLTLRWNFEMTPPPPHIKIYMQLNVMLTEKILLVWPT